MTQIVIDANGEELAGEMVEAAGYKGGKAENIDMAKERKKPESDRMFPLFVYEKEGEKIYILSIRGNGLWDEIWGNVALKEDLQTLVGASFDHKGETPGLGAEITDNPSFRDQFTGKKLYKDGEYTSIIVRKGGAKDPVNEVDGISGATVTCDGVSEMLFRGVKYYSEYLQNLNSNSES